MKPLRIMLLLIICSLFVLSGTMVSGQDGGEADTIAPDKEGQAFINGIEMYYAIYGEGEPLIMLHGGLGHSGYWYNQVGPFAEHYQVITLDSRGHGRSTFDEEPIGYALMASDVVAMMDFLEIESADMVGWSDGGIIILYLAINHPDRLNRVVAYGANYNVSGVRAENVETDETFGAYVELAVEDYLALSPAPERLDEFFENIGTMWATEPDFSEEELGSITTPILILDGDADEAIFTEHTIEMAGLIPSAELTLIEGTGHFAMWEKPEEFNQIILEFLGE